MGTASQSFMGMNFGTEPTPGGGSNQFFSNMPTLPTMFNSASPASTPGVVPQAPNENLPNSQTRSSVNPFTHDIGGGVRAISPIDPNLTGGLFNFLTGQIGQGATPFNLSSLLPTGGTTGAGELSAPLNPILQQLLKFFTTGQGGTPGMDTLSQFSKGIDVLPSFNAITGVMDRNTAEGAANLKEQFNVGGNLVGSPFGTAAADYQDQATKDKSSILAQLYQNTLPLQEGAATTLAGMGAQAGNMFQNLDQASIDRLLQEFIRTRPEYNPLLNLEFGAATTFPPTTQNKTGGGILQSLLPQLTSAGGAGIASGASGGSLKDILSAIGLAL